MAIVGTGIVIRPRATLFHAEGCWFSANWHFSFDQYRDEANSQWGDLRVFNDDRLVPGAVWPMHPHRDIWGITYVAEATFEHADSLGNGGLLAPGSVQRSPSPLRTQVQIDPSGSLSMTSQLSPRRRRRLA